MHSLLYLGPQRTSHVGPGVSSAAQSGLLLLLLSHFSRVRLLATPWTAAYQAPPSMGFSRQEYWSGAPLPSPKKLIHSSAYYEYSIVPTI